MIRVHEAQNLAEAHLVRALLEANGIRAEIRGDTLFSTLGSGMSVPGVLPAIWVADPNEADAAFALVSTFSAGALAELAGDPSWHCPTCQEFHEPQFSTCWKCGAEKPAAP
jgi:hypothetical protein